MQQGRVQGQLSQVPADKKNIFMTQSQNKEYAERMMGLIAPVDGLTLQISALTQDI